MVTLAQRIELLRTEGGASRAALSVALGFPKGAFEKFETGRQTPSKEQQEKLAAYFGVSLFYLRGESNDRTRQDSWMEDAGGGGEVERPQAPAPRVERPKSTETGQGAVLDSFLVSKQVRELLRAVVLETLKSAEGQALIAEALRKELASRGQ